MFLLACLAVVGLVLGLWRAPELRRILGRWMNQRQYAHASRVVEDFEKRIDAMVISVGLHTTQAEWIYVMSLMSDGEREGLILDPTDPAQAEPRFMSDHTAGG